MLQELRVAQAAVTERQPEKVGKTLENKLVMPKYWGKFLHTGVSPKWVKSKRRREKKEEEEERKTERW